MKKLIKWALMGFVGLVILVLLIDSGKSPEEKKAEAAAAAQGEAAAAAEKAAQAKKEMESLRQVTVDELAQAYEDNTVAADQQFKGKQFKISGTVVDINTDLMGNPYITLNGGNEFMRPQFSFDKTDLEQIAKLKKGNKVTMVCEGRGDIAKTPMSGSCIFL